MLVKHLTTPMFSKISMTSMAKRARSGQCYSVSIREGVRCSSMVKVFAHGAMCHWIDPSWWTH